MGQFLSVFKCHKYYKKVYTRRVSVTWSSFKILTDRPIIIFALLNSKAFTFLSRDASAERGYEIACRPSVSV